MMLFTHAGLRRRRGLRSTLRGRWLLKQQTKQKPARWSRSMDLPSTGHSMSCSAQTPRWTGDWGLSVLAGRRAT